MGEPETDIDPEKRRDHTGDLARFVDALRSLAKVAIHGRSLLRHEEAGDVAGQAFLELSQEYGAFPPLPTPRQARRAIDRVADRIQKRRKRRSEGIRRIESESKTKRRGRRSKTLGGTPDPLRLSAKRSVGVPTLCRRLMALGKGTRFETQIAGLVIDAATVVVADPNSFSANQIALYTLAWRDGLSAAEIVGTAGTKTPRAVTDRLYRISRKVENELVSYLDSVLPSGPRGQVVRLLRAEPSKKRRDTVSSLSAEACDRLSVALEALIHRNPR